MDKTKKTREAELEEKKDSGWVDILNPFTDSQESVTKSLQLLASALTLVAGLAWNEAIKGFIDKVLQPALSTIFSKAFGDLAAVVSPFVYAILITGIVVYFVNRIKRIEDRLEKPKRKAKK